ncbi:uncharacterized protein LOC105385999 [Plutella xylostella]|uniref:uncharacterized protein LOC105385999 n=1 Tax=Plutella xylostella TaxID=51655 RepID=UPI0020330874|nr:uncharacterized protein LOC105385999 [Plutella xylostella]
MKVLVVLLLLCAGGAYSDMSQDCDMAAFYLELGCTPSAADNSTCPQAFTCPDLHPDPTMCYYRGVAYKDGAMIPESLVRNPCSMYCSCSLRDVTPQFHCVAVDCPEFFNSDEKEQCIYTYQPMECCPTAKVCGKDAIANLSTCEVDGKVYLEGQTFKKSHKTCVCSAQWNGSTDNPADCREVNCGIEIHYQDKLMNRCAPVFVNARSCPFTFECQTPKSKIIRGLNVRAADSECVFGNMTLAIGDELVADEPCTICTCQVPPFVTCIKKTACDN